ncbi:MULTISPECIES: nucleoside deaminase [unclassified Variovorax]|uniref:nucleoside deaminase n=1 Tax=unclassified Variovorax TaxID=663243 RepID=UPI0008D16556|nr:MULTISPECIES: nucleoside deaminase [unclassified Variovorax]SEI96901.1 tRNA(Arg) A34 adenosine deaminase TadA [Variovorax sp. OK202]SFB87834.1 tRNA(Arg) A34 adenosine deaminase TadA [Variovorax sp. OK212]
MYQQEFMQRALALSAQALQEPGTEPFGAVVVKDGVIVGEGFNHSVAHSDPTSHGEVEAIRDACRKLGTVSLAGCDLYTSCEPCAMCVAAMHIAGIAKLYYAATLAQSGNAFDGVPVASRHPIDVEVLRIEAGATLARRSLPAEQKLDREAVQILSDWAATRRAG